MTQPGSDNTIRCLCGRDEWCDFCKPKRQHQAGHYLTGVAG